jgi:hypothetical protein
VHRFHSSRNFFGGSLTASGLHVSALNFQVGNVDVSLQVVCQVDSLPCLRVRKSLKSSQVRAVVGHRPQLFKIDERSDAHVLILLQPEHLLHREPNVKLNDHLNN